MFSLLFAVSFSLPANAQTFTTLDDPLGVHGTYARGISGNNVVGLYEDSSSRSHGFITTIVPEPSTFALLGIGASALLVMAFGGNGGNWRQLLHSQPLKTHLILTGTTDPNRKLRWRVRDRALTAN